MLDPRRHAAALLAALLLAVPAPALAQEPVLVAQIEDATPTPAPDGNAPPLSEAPEGLDGEEEAAPEPAEEEESATSGDDGNANDPLPNTGLDAGLVALLGLGLLASGSGLHVSLRRNGA